jgi:hypothetical protein
LWEFWEFWEFWGVEYGRGAVMVIVAREGQGGDISMFQRWSDRLGEGASDCHGEDDEAGPLFSEGYHGGQKRLLQVDVRKDDVLGVPCPRITSSRCLAGIHGHVMDSWCSTPLKTVIKPPRKQQVQYYNIA